MSQNCAQNKRKTGFYKSTLWHRQHWATVCSLDRELGYEILDYPKLKEFADNNFKFDENVRKFSKRVENIVGKGEIARYEQFLLFAQCF